MRQLVSALGFFTIATNASAGPKASDLPCTVFFEQISSKTSKTSLATVSSTKSHPDLSNRGLTFLGYEGRNGAWYVDSQAIKWFVKPDSEARELQTAAEVVTSGIYRKLGYDAAETKLLVVDGRRFTAAKAIEGGKPSDLSDLSSSSDVRQLRIFAAYLKDWDRVIASNNFVMPDGKIAIHDFGGSLGARAQGQFKPGAIHSDATGAFENTTDFAKIFTSFRTDDLKHSHPFNSLTRADALKAVARLKLLDDSSIAAIVDSAHYSSRGDRDHIVSALVNRRNAIIEHLLSQFPEREPGTDEIGKKLFAVHATDNIPDSGVMKAGAQSVGGDDMKFISRNTIHFSLGELVRGHSAGHWEWKKAAVLTPVEKIQTKLVNLHPYDSFVLGDLKIPEGSILVVPRGTTVPNIPGVKVHFYDGALRDAVDEAIIGNNGWSVSMRGGHGQSKLGDFDLSQSNFFDRMLKNNPQMSFGYSEHSVKGQAERFAMVETKILKYLKTYFHHENSTLTSQRVRVASTPQLNLVKNYLEFQSARLRQFFSKHGVPDSVKAAFEKQQTELKATLNLINQDLRLRSETGRTIQNSSQAILDQLKNKWDDPSQLREWSNSQSKRANSKLRFLTFPSKKLTAVPKENRQETLSSLVEMASELPDAEAVVFVKSNFIFSSTEEQEQFWRKVRAERDNVRAHFGEKTL